MTRKKLRNLLALACVFALLLPALPATAAALSEPAASSNRNNQDYNTWSKPVVSYLCENEAGGLTRVEYIENQMIVEDYNSSFKLQSSRTIQPELPVWGGFFAGKDYNFLIFGQNNPSESDSVEVIRIVKYDKAWNRIAQASLYGANTKEPFHFGCLRCDEYGGYLYIRTCHTMYKSQDGLNHQANVTLCVRETDMTITDALYDVRNVSYGYVSHSFNQFILVGQDGRIVAADHGDAYPRSIVLLTYPEKAGSESFVPAGFSDQVLAAELAEFSGRIGQNDTGASLGGLEETRDCYVAAYSYNDQGGGSSPRYPYYHTIHKQTGEHWSFKPDISGVTTPVFASKGPEGGYMLWNGKENNKANDTLYYMPYAADGKPGDVYTASAPLSDCKPIYYNGKMVWYVTDNSTPVFYTLDDSGVTRIPTSAPAPENTPAVQTTAPAPTPAPSSKDVEPSPYGGTAYVSSSTITVDGQPVGFKTYALRNTSGETNYIKLRDIAYTLNGTKAQFQVKWDGRVNLSTHTPYTADGTEMQAFFDGNRAYQDASAATTVDGAEVPMSAILLKDDAGNGYTYYKLRDLGRILGFNVDWNADQGIYIESDRPYGSSAEPSPSPSPTPSPSLSPSLSPASKAAISVIATQQPAVKLPALGQTPTPSPSPTQTPSPTPSPVSSPQPAPSALPTATPTPAPVPTPSAEPASADELAAEVVRLVNVERAKEGLAPLGTFDSLTEAAQLRAPELATLFSHDRPDGTSCFTALDATGAKTNAYTWGENIAAGNKTAAATVEQWMNSPGHRANILNKDFTHIGVGYASGGPYRHNWVQMFVGIPEGKAPGGGSSTPASTPTPAGTPAPTPTPTPAPASDSKYQTSDVPEDGRTTYYREDWSEPWGDNYLSMEIVDGKTIQFSGCYTPPPEIAYNYAVLSTFYAKEEVPIQSGVPFSGTVEIDVQRLIQEYGDDHSVTRSMVVFMCCQNYTPGDSAFAGVSFPSSADIFLAKDGRGGCEFYIK